MILYDTMAETDRNAHRAAFKEKNLTAIGGKVFEGLTVVW